MNGYLWVRPTENERSECEHSAADRAYLDGAVLHVLPNDVFDKRGLAIGTLEGLDSHPRRIDTAPVVVWCPRCGAFGRQIL